MIVREIKAKSILSASKIADYVINPYIGCQHGCSYCYARFMKRYTGHIEAWGEFVDVKINAAELLEKEITRKKPGTVWISGVCDPYQPLEARYRLTRRCLEILVRFDWSFFIQTRSPLVLRDRDIILRATRAEVCFSIATGDENIRRIFEPHAPPVEARIKALKELHDAGITTVVMIAPLLPGAETLPSRLKGKVDRIQVDRMNYHYADWVYKKYHLEEKLSDDFFHQMADRLEADCIREGLDCRVFFR